MSRYVAYRLAQWLSVHLPPAAAFACAERLAEWWWRYSARDRAAVRANLALLLDEPSSARDALGREVFRNFGRYLVEFFTIHQTSHPECQVEGLEHLERAQASARGLILLTGHLGNWEVGSVLVRRMGFPVTVVARPHADARLDRLFNRQRQRCGLTVIAAGRDAARRSLERLHGGQCLGLIGDRVFDGNSVEVTVGSRRLPLPRGPALLSLRSQAPVVPTFLIRQGRWRFRLCFEPPIWPASGQGREASVRALTQRYAAVFERYLTRFPEQWLRFQA
jgi:KDO2-lipid IV(A) lauroyltransferase